MPAQTLYTATRSITIEGQNKISHGEHRFNQYPATNPALHKILEGKLQPPQKRWLHQKKKVIDDHMAANQKEWKSVQNNITNN